MKTPEERDAAREAKRAARRLAGTTRHLELPVSPDEALAMLREAAERRTPMMRLLRYTGESAEVSVRGALLGSYGTAGSIGAATSLLGYGLGVKVTWASRSPGRGSAGAPSTRPTRRRWARCS